MRKIENESLIYGLAMSESLRGRGGLGYVMLIGQNHQEY